MSETNETLDIRIEISLEEPDVQIGIENSVPDIEIELDGAGQSYPPYTGDVTVTPIPWEQQVLETANKALKSDIVILEIPYSSVSNPMNGKTVYIGQ